MYFFHDLFPFSRFSFTCDFHAIYLFSRHVFSQLFFSPPNCVFPPVIYTQFPHAFFTQFIFIYSQIANLFCTLSFFSWFSRIMFIFARDVFHKCCCFCFFYQFIYFHLQFVHNSFGFFFFFTQFVYFHMQFVHNSYLFIFWCDFYMFFYSHGKFFIPTCVFHN